MQDGLHVLRDVTHSADVVRVGISCENYGQEVDLRDEGTVHVEVVQLGQGEDTGFNEIFKGSDAISECALDLRESGAGAACVLL